MSLRPVFGRSSTRRVVVDAVVLRLHPQRDRAPCRPSSSTFEISPTSTPAMFDGLALARRDRLRGRQLGLDDEEVLADERHPGGQRAGAGCRGCRRRPRREISDQADDRDEVEPVLADRGRHGVAFTRPAPAPRPVDVGQLALVTGDARVVRRALARVLRPHAEHRRRRRADELAGRGRRRARRCSRRRRAGSARRSRCRRSSGSRRRARPSSTRTPCSSPSPFELVVDHDVAGRQHDVARAARRVGRSAAAALSVASVSDREVASSPARGPRPARAARSATAACASRDPRERRVDRRRRLAHAGQDLARERARGREGAR